MRHKGKRVGQEGGGDGAVSGASGELSFIVGKSIILQRSHSENGPHKSHASVLIRAAWLRALMGVAAVNASGLASTPLGRKLAAY